MVTRQDFDGAARRSTRRRTPYPLATAARYDRDLGYLVVSFGANLDLAIAPQNIEALAQATPEELDQVEISSSGLGLRFPRLEAKLYLPPLLKGLHRSWR
ncbi:MAG TPA: DUF2442 domain-containing protein [Dongiaceae bacterium]|jgi:hypothetical protein|nr:DUF2442 domain-containing protein [Dongiaceae bacterium]